MATKTTSNPYQIKVKDSDNFMTAMGVTKKRSQELLKLTLKAASKAGAEARKSDLLSAVSVNCKNANELAVTCFIIGEASAASRAAERAQKVRKLLELFAK